MQTACLNAMTTFTDPNGSALLNYLFLSSYQNKTPQVEDAAANLQAQIGALPNTDEAVEESEDSPLTAQQANDTQLVVAALEQQTKESQETVKLLMEENQRIKGAFIFILILQIIVQIFDVKLFEYFHF